MNTCYCEVPWTGRPLPMRQTDRAHIARPECSRRSDTRPEWLKRGEFRRDGLNLTSR